MLKNISLDDKYKLENKFILVNGTQALVRATLIQKFRDEKENLKTAGFVTGYRGSPVGNVDLQFSKVKKLISEKDIKFHPGLNEDIAATSLWGSQQAEMRGESNYDGVFGFWYGISIPFLPYPSLPQHVVKTKNIIFVIPESL